MKISFVNWWIYLADSVVQGVRLATEPGIEDIATKFEKGTFVV
jgi:hypothetical protein